MKLCVSCQPLPQDNSLHTITMSEELLAKADAMEDNKQFGELVALLESELKSDPQNVELLWRLARATYDIYAVVV